MADIEVKNKGSIILLIPGSDEGKRWIDKNLALEEWQWYGGGAAVDSRYAEDIIEGMQVDGLEVAGTKRIIPEEHDLTLEDEARLIDQGIVAPPSKQAAALPQQPAKPGQPQVDPEVATDLKVDPWAMIQDNLAREQQPEESKPPVMPEKHTVEPEIPGGPYHMVGARDACLTRPRTGRMGPGDDPRNLGNGKTGIVGGKKAIGTIVGEDNMEKKSSRELLREKIAAMTEAKKARTFGRLREVAEKEPKKAGDVLGELASSLGVMASSISNLRATWT